MDATLTQVSGEFAERASLEGGVFAFLVVRNEILRIKHCLEHHRKLGVRKFFVVDNGSDDGTFSILRDQPDVILFETSEVLQQKP